MSVVLKFPTPKVKGTRPIDNRIYLACTHCEGEKFRLEENGNVMCGDCGRHISNLRVLRIW